MKTRYTQTLALSLVVLLALASVEAGAGTGAGPLSQPDRCGGGALDGADPVYLGAWIPAALDDPRIPHGADPLGQFEAKAGKGVSILQRWEHWGLGTGGRVDIKWLRRVAEQGAYPMITWVPWDPTIPEPAAQTGFLMRDVAAGAHDAYIADIASEVAEWGRPTVHPLRAGDERHLVSLGQAPEQPGRVHRGLAPTSIRSLPSGGLATSPGSGTSARRITPNR